LEGAGEYPVDSCTAETWQIMQLRVVERERKGGYKDIEEKKKRR
jgi:hypothetical protein